MPPKLSLFLTFAKRTAPALLVVDIAFLQLVWLYGSAIVLILIWAKIISSVLPFYLVRKLRPTEAFYYRNLGLTPTRLWLTLFGVDFLLFSTAIITLLSGNPYA